MNCCHQSLPKTFLPLTLAQCSSVGAPLSAIALRLGKALDLTRALDVETQAKDRSLLEFNLSTDFKEPGMRNLLQTESITHIWNNIIHVKIEMIE